MGLFKEDRSVNRRIRVFKTMAKEIIENKLKKGDYEDGTVLHAINEKKLLNA